MKEFCSVALVHEGMSEQYTRITAVVLAETDDYGMYSHGIENLHGYNKKAHVIASDIITEPVVIKDSSVFVINDAQNGIGMVTWRSTPTTSSARSTTYRGMALR